MCGSSSTYLPFALSSLFLSLLTMTLLTALACPFPCGSTRCSPICPKDVWQLFHPFFLCIIRPLLESIHYNLIYSLDLFIPLWISRCGIPIRNAQVTIVPLEGFVIKLKTIVRDKGMRDPKPSDNIFPNKSLGIHIPDICQWFSFNPLGEVIRVD